MTPEPIADESPFFTVWEAPRETIRHLVATDPRRGVNWLFFAAGAVGGLDAASRWAQTWDVPPYVVPLACVAVGLLGIPTGHANAWYKRWVGSLLGGTATQSQVAAASAWAGVPVIAGNGGLWLVRIGLYGRELFSTEHPTLDAASRLVGITFNLAAALFAVWAVVISVAAFAEVNRFSILRSIATSILAAVIVATVAAVLLVALFVVAGAMRG